LRRLLLLVALWQAVGPVPSPRPLAQDERLKRIQERRGTLEKELIRLRGEERSLLGDVERLELEVRVQSEKLAETHLFLQKANELMDITLGRVRELERTINETRPVLAARARALYKLGELSYVRLVLSVDRPSDIFRGYRFATALARRDNERIAAFRADLLALATTKKVLEQRTEEALHLRTELERTRQGLEADRKRKTELLKRIVDRKETYVAFVKELEEAEGKLRQLLLGLSEGDVNVPLTVYKGALPWPVVGRIRVPFGLRKHPRFDTYTVQNGVEIDAPAEAPVAAVHDGTVVFADRFLGYGLMVVLDHGGKHHTLYAHLSEAFVRQGQKVAAGETIGNVGQSGLEGPGLYFEVRFQGRPEDPKEWLARRVEGRTHGIIPP